MALRHVFIVALSVVAMTACRRDTAPAAEVSDEAAEPLRVTRWTDKTELFAEYPSLVTCHTSRFAIHLTTLDPFKAVTDGTMEVQLRSADGQVESFSAKGPSRHIRRGRDARSRWQARSDYCVALACDVGHPQRGCS